MNSDPQGEPRQTGEQQPNARHNLELIVVRIVLILVGVGLATFLLVALWP